MDDHPASTERDGDWIEVPLYAGRREPLVPRRPSGLGNFLLPGCLLLLLFMAGRLSGQPWAHWRIYRAADGLLDSHVATVNVGQSGRIWLTHNDNTGITLLDGYRASHWPATGNGNFEIQEGANGQLWTLALNGLQTLINGEWRLYPVAPIQEEIQANPIRRVRPISVLPSGEDRVLFLLPDGLWQYSLRSNQCVVIQQAAETSLGAFNEMIPARDGGIWISGLQGLLKMTGSLTEPPGGWQWGELRPPPELAVTNLQSLTEDDEGALVVVADLLQETARCAVIYDGRSWTKQVMLGGKLRQAWRGPDRILWAQAINGLERWDPNHPGKSDEEGMIGGQLYDVAVEPKGVFWLATSEGLIRYAPLLWREPHELPGVTPTSVHAICEDAQHRLWCARANNLMLWYNQTWRFFSYPVESDLLFQPTDLLRALPDGRLLIGATLQCLLFDPQTESFQNLVHSQATAIRFLGQFPSGDACFQVFPTNGTTAPFRLERYRSGQFEAFWQPPENWAWGAEIHSFLALTNGDVWLGNNRGLGFLRDGRWHAFSRADGQPPESAFCLLESGEGGILCGGLEKLYAFDGRIWTVLRSGFDRINALFRSRDGAVWIAANDGVYRYLNGHWLKNDLEDGLPSSVCYRIYQDRRNTIWAGTARGLSRYHPDADLDPPRTWVSRARPGDIVYGDMPALFSLGGLDKWKYTKTDRLVYAYRLDSVTWSAFQGETTLALNNLTPGRHRLEARAMDSNGNIDPHPFLYEFAVVLPWYLETRLLIITFCGLAAVLFFAALSVNRHLRLKRSHAEIERTVAQRTSELEQANKALLHSQKMRALGTLAAGIAHDFNSILSIIKGSAQIIGDNLQDRNKVLTRLDRIKSVVDQGSGIVKSLLGFSRITDEALSLADVNTVVEETARLVGDRILSGISLNPQLTPKLPEVPCDRGLLQQMLLNLIFNAADAMKGQGTIILRTTLWSQFPSGIILEPAPANRYVTIMVLDTGCGIKPEMLSRIFEPFFTTKSFSSRHGTGLGLSMVYEFAKGLGFGLHVESSVGQGSTFSVLLPVKEPSVVPQYKKD